MHALYMYASICVCMYTCIVYLCMYIPLVYAYMYVCMSNICIIRIFIVYCLLIVVYCIVLHLVFVSI